MLIYLGSLVPCLPASHSQWTSVLDLLEWYMDLRGHPYCRLDGSTQVWPALGCMRAMRVGMGQACLCAWVTGRASRKSHLFTVCCLL